MHIQNERRNLLETMLFAIDRIKLGNKFQVYEYSNALINLISMDRHNVDIVISYISKVKMLEDSLPLEDKEGKLEILGHEYNKAIHRIQGKEYQEELIDHHAKKITTEFIIKNNSSILFIDKEKFDVEYHKMVLCKMLLVNNNITINSDTTFLCHEYIKLLSQLGNEKELKYANRVCRYVDEEERLVRFGDYVGHLWLTEASTYEIEIHERAEKNQQILLEGLEKKFNEAIEYFLGLSEKSTYNFDGI